MEKCSFCQELENGLKAVNDSLYNKLYNVFGDKRIIKKTDSWAILPTIGCFIEGYILAVNKSHYTSLYSCDIFSRKEIETLMHDIQKAFNELYGSRLICFEHGTISSSYSSCSIEHSHIHFLPIKKCIWFDFLREYNPTYYRINSLDELCSVVNSRRLPSYLFLKDADNQMYIISPDPVKYPSQFFRMYTLKQLNIDGDWNWKNDHYFENMWKTYITMSKYFSCSNME